MSMEKRNAAVFILLGQSNAVGHGIPMKESDKITKPLSHVFGLSRALNQTLHPQKLTFSGYLSAGMNLAETQDDTYSLANCLAKRWESAAEMNPALPDLFIIQIAIGAQGVGPGYMWNPDYPETMVPGRLGEVKISLFPYTERILSLLKPTFEGLGAAYDILALHWRGGENDTITDMPRVMIPLLKPIYRQLFAMFERALGTMPPTVLYESKFGLRNLNRTDGVNLANMCATTMALNGMFRAFAEEIPEISTFDPFSLSLYDPEEPLTWGIFSPADGVHYSGSANDEIAGQIMRQAEEKYCGHIIGNTP